MQEKDQKELLRNSCTQDAFIFYLSRINAMTSSLENLLTNRRATGKPPIFAALLITLPFQVVSNQSRPQSLRYFRPAAKNVGSGIIHFWDNLIGYSILETTHAQDSGNKIYPMKIELSKQSGVPNFRSKQKLTFFNGFIVSIKNLVFVFQHTSPLQ